jgi:Schlafen, AlbA_2
MDLTTTVAVIADGEGQHVEFKQTFAEEDDGIKSLCAFANASGGRVLFGVKNNGEIVGSDIGRNTLENFASKLRSNTDPRITPVIEKLTIDGRAIISVEVESLRRDQVVFAFGRPYIRVGKTNQIMGPEQIRARLKDTHIAGDHVRNAAALRAIAAGFRIQIVSGRLEYAELEMSRGDRGFRNFLRKIGAQRVCCPELMSADLLELTPAQCEILGRYRAAERELDVFLANVSDNMEKFELKPKNALAGFFHRLKKLSDVLDQLIVVLAPQ